MSTNEDKKSLKRHRGDGSSDSEEHVDKKQFNFIELLSIDSEQSSESSDSFDEECISEKLIEEWAKGLALFMEFDPDRTIKWVHNVDQTQQALFAFNGDSYPKELREYIIKSRIELAKKFEQINDQFLGRSADLFFEIIRRHRNKNEF